MQTNAKLTNVQADEIRVRYAANPYRGHIRIIAADYDVTGLTISNIIHNKKYVKRG